MSKKFYREALLDIQIQKSNLYFLYLITGIVACCSILYELLLAQSLATTMGNTALRYNITIGLYIAAMGVGALLYKKIIKRDIFEEFIKVELLLSLVGGISPVAVLIFDYVFYKIASVTEMSFFSWWLQWPLFMLNHFLIILIGFLSGLELPLLIEIGKKIGSKNGGSVLGFDYLGTLVGAIFFPIVILPALHIFTIGYVVSALNLFVALFAIIKFKIKKRSYKINLTIFFIVWFFAILNASTLNEKIVKLFYFGGQ